MIVTHKIKMDLAHREIPAGIDMVQDDQYSRNVQLCLYANGMPFALPADCTAMVKYQKADGTGGRYDSMPDGKKAWMIKGNLLTIRVAPQVCSCAGKVEFVVALQHQGTQLHCFTLYFRIQETPDVPMASENYENTNVFLPQTVFAKEGGFLKAAKVDNQGRVTAVETAEAVAGIGGAAADWDQSDPRSGGFVKNRTHWREDITAETISWDGEMTDRDCLYWDTNLCFAKVSDRVLSKEGFLGAVAALDEAGTEQEFVLEEAGYEDLSGQGYPAFAYIVTMNDIVIPAVVCLTEDSFIEGTLYTAGLYFVCRQESGAAIRTSALSIPEATIHHKLDTQYLPETVMLLPTGGKPGNRLAMGMNGNLVWASAEYGEYPIAEEVAF